MKTKDRPRFDLDTLRNTAGDKVFARGEDYFRDGEVQILAIEPRRVLAQVTGSEDYRTELVGNDKSIGGECSCPAFEDWGFCKHMVATALAANAVGDDAEAEGVGALTAIRAYLKEKSVDTLAGMIVELAERDPALFRKLDLAATTARTDDKTLEARLRKVIDGATRTAGYIDYREAGGWATDVDAALDAVEGLASGPRAGLALKLMEHAIGRIEDAVENIDDSDGHCSALLDRARDIHVAAAAVARPEPVQFARDLFAREMKSEYQTFDGAVVLYDDALGEDGRAEYRRLAVAAWDKLASRPRKAPDVDAYEGNYHQLKNILDIFAERDGDLETRIALRARDLSSTSSYLRLAEFCLAHGREEEALRRGRPCANMELQSARRKVSSKRPRRRIHARRLRSMPNSSITSPTPAATRKP
jgi:SWIM zinc finger